MSRKTTHMKLTGGCLVLALAILAPEAAHGASTRYDGPERARRTPALHKGHVGTAVWSSERTTIRVESTGGKPAAQPTGPAHRRAGLGWLQAGIGVGILVGILLLGVWGDVAVGAVLFAIATLVGTAAKVVTCKPLTRQSGPRLAARITAQGHDNPPAEISPTS